MKFELLPDESATINSISSPEVSKPIISIEELESLCEGNDDLKELLDDMIKSCLDYTITVAKWKESHAQNKGQLTEEFVDVDTLRTSVHNRTIADINLFGRSLRRFGIDNSWMDKAGLDGKNRGAYGKFALTLSLSRLKAEPLTNAE